MAGSDVTARMDDGVTDHVLLSLSICCCYFGGKLILFHLSPPVMPGVAPKSPKLGQIRHQMGQILGFFKISFQNVLKTYLKSPRSDQFGANVAHCVAKPDIPVSTSGD